MISASVLVDSDSCQHYLTDLTAQQLPYALSKATNQATLDIREVVQAKNRSSFIIRRPWVLQGWRVKLSNKNDRPIAATLWLDPSRGFLAKFEDGGIKTSSKGVSLPVPVNARATPSALIPTNLQIRSLHLQAHRTAGGKVQLKGDQRTFILKTGSRALLFQRTGKGLRLLYSFKRSVPIPASLHFFQTAQNYLTNEWPGIMGEALANAIRTAR